MFFKRLRSISAYFAISYGGALLGFILGNAIFVWALHPTVKLLDNLLPQIAKPLVILNFFIGCVICPAIGFIYTSIYWAGRTKTEPSLLFDEKPKDLESGK